MNNFTQKLILLAGVAMLLVLVSCGKEEVEKMNSVVVDHPVIKDSEEQEICNTGFSVADTNGVQMVDYGESLAALFMPGTQSFSWIPENSYYLVVYDNNMEWPEGIKVGKSLPGMKGFEIFSSTPFESDVTYDLVGNSGSNLEFPGSVDMQEGGRLLFPSVTLSRAGSEVNDFVEGRLEALLYNHADTCGAVPIIATFCALITEIIE